MNGNVTKKRVAAARLGPAGEIKASQNVKLYILFLIYFFSLFYKYVLSSFAGNNRCRIWRRLLDAASYSTFSFKMNE